MTTHALGTITGGDPVEVAGHDLVGKCTLGPSGLGSAKYLGVAAHDAISGANVTVIMDRVVHEGTADGAVTAGAQVMASAKAGCQVKTVPASTATPGQADVDAARVIIGVALTTATDGGTLRWAQTR